jgi:hypothetical protein
MQNDASASTTDILMLSLEEVFGEPLNKLQILPFSIPTFVSM